MKQYQGFRERIGVSAPQGLSLDTLYKLEALKFGPRGHGAKKPHRIGFNMRLNLLRLPPHPNTVGEITKHWKTISRRAFDHIKKRATMA
jgi:hypothetical protein